MPNYKLYSYLLYSLLFALLAQTSSAQTATDMQCGNISSSYSSLHLKAKGTTLKTHKARYYNALNSTDKKAQLKQRIPIQIHVFTTEGNTNATLDITIKRSLERLNNQFAKALLEFYSYGTATLITSKNTALFKKDDVASFTAPYYTEGVINLYITPHLVNSSDTNICGFVANIPNKHSIILQNDCFLNNSSLAHEMGHFLSLLHTHGKVNAKTTELANGSNCDSTGDGICDTPADPKLSPQTLNNFCEYIGTARDANGDVFTPDTKNIMSYGHKACRSHFSNEQMARMFAYYNSIKQDILNGKTPANTMSTDTTDSTSVTRDTTLISVYPNPITAAKIYIKGIPQTITVPYNIRNYRGQLLAKGITSNEHGISVSHLPSGVYLLILSLEGKNSIIKIMK